MIPEYAAYLRTLLEEELRTFRVAGTVEALRSLLVDPYLRDLDWEWDGPIHPRPVLVFAQTPTGLQLVHSQAGYAGAPWGLVPATATEFGPDSAWFLTLEDCYLQSGHWQGDFPENYEVQ